MSATSEPKERSETLRQSLLAALRGATLTARELSGIVRIPEREVVEHLAHLDRSLAAAGERLVVEPARCRRCGHGFEARTRHARPSRCPSCRGERISSPRFSVVSAADS